MRLTIFKFIIIGILIQGCNTNTTENKNYTTEELELEESKIIFIDNEFTVFIPNNYEKIIGISDTTHTTYYSLKDSSNFQFSVGENSFTIQMLKDQGIDPVTLDTIVDLHSKFHYEQIKNRLVDTSDVSKIIKIENDQFPSRRFIITGRIPEGKYLQTYLCENITTATKSMYFLFYCRAESFKKRESEYLEIINSLKSKYK